MTEQAINSRLNDYLDGELSPAEVASFEDALSKDPALQAELESVQAALEVLRTQGPLTAPEGFHARVMAEAALEPMPQVGLFDRLKRFFRELPMETLAMAVAAAIVLVLVGRLVPESNEPATDAAALEPAELSTAAKTEQAPTKARQEKAKEDAEPASEKEEEVDPIREVADMLTVGSVDREDTGPSKAAGPSTAEGSTGDAVAVMDLGAKGAPPEKGVNPAEDGMSTGPEAKGETPSSAEPEGLDLEAQLNAAMAYSLVVTDPSSLRQIAALAERHGGRAVNAKTGKALSDSDLEDGRAQVQVRIPPAQLASFSAALGSLGSAQRTSMNDANLYGPDTISVNLDVRLK